MSGYTYLVIDNAAISSTTITSAWQKSFYDEMMMVNQNLPAISRLHAKTPVIITDASIGLYDSYSMMYQPEIHIGDADQKSSVTIKTNSNSLYVPNAVFYTPDSDYILNNSQASQATDLTIRNNLGGWGLILRKTYMA